jgi:hypothetical protein
VTEHLQPVSQVAIDIAKVVFKQCRYGRFVEHEGIENDAVGVKWNEGRGARREPTVSGTLYRREGSSGRSILAGS